MSGLQERAFDLGTAWVEAVLRGRWLLLPLVGLVTVLAGWMATRVGVDNAVEVWFVDDDPSLLAYHQFQQEFGNDEVLALAIHREGGVLDDAGLKEIEAASRAVAAVEGIASVTSLTTVADVRVTTDSDGVEALEVGKLASPAWRQDASAWEAAVLADPLYKGRLVSADGKTALVIAKMATMQDFDKERDAVLARVDAALSAEGIEGIEARRAGIGVIYAALNKLSTVDSARFIVASYLVIVAVLWVLFGRLAPMALAMGAVGAGAVWLMGVFGLAGRDINMVTMILPTLVLIIGVSDCVHVMNHVAELAEEHPERPRWELVREGVGFVWWPCLFNTLTTAVGFASLATAPMAVLRDLGVFAAIGLLVAFTVALILCPIALLRPSFQPLLSNKGKVQAFVDACVGLALDKPAQVLMVAALVALASAIGISKLEVDTWSIQFFKERHPVRQDSDWIEANVGPYTPLEFVVRADTPGGLQSPAALQAIADWQARMEAHPDVGGTLSVADIAIRLHAALSADHAQIVPPTPEALEQALLLYTSSPDADLTPWVQGGWSAARVTVQVPMRSAKGTEAIVEALRAEAKLPPGLRLEVAGYLPLYIQMMRYIVESQLSSFGVSFLVIFGLIALLFRSARLAAMAVPANLLPILITLGVMGFAGIRLDVATVTIGSIVLGLVVDDTVQFLYRYRHELARRGDARAATEVTARSLGRSLVITALVLSLGFSVLGLAEVRSVAWFGLLVALALGTGVLGDLLVLPAMLALQHRRREA